MINHQDRNVYDIILKKERKDQLFFWSVMTICFLVGAIILCASIWAHV